MIFLFLLLTTSAFAEVDVSAIREFEGNLPDYESIKASEEELEFQRQNRRFIPPVRTVEMEKILSSGIQQGAIKAGAVIRNIKTNKNYTVKSLMYVNFYNLEDEHNFKYLQNKDGTVTWRVHSFLMNPLKEELAMYEPPLRYTPAPQIIRTEYDSKLKLPPELGLYTGFVRGSYMADLLNDTSANSGVTNQFALHVATDWKVPIKVGAVINYERASYKLTNGGQALYSAMSFGPQFKTKNFEIMNHPIRFQTQFRVSPFARMAVETAAKDQVYKFNSADLLTSIERPISNRWGEFVLGFFFQSQWLSLKQQPENVSVNATNNANKSFGLSFAQVFQ